VVHQIVSPKVTADRFSYDSGAADPLDERARH